MIGSRQVEVALVGAGAFSKAGEIDGLDGEANSLHAQTSAAAATIKEDTLRMRDPRENGLETRDDETDSCGVDCEKKTGTSRCLSSPSPSNSYSLHGKLGNGGITSVIVYANGK